jgi:hypothetical protein
MCLEQIVLANASGYQGGVSKWLSVASQGSRVEFVWTVMLEFDWLSGGITVACDLVMLMVGEDLW